MDTKPEYITVTLELKVNGKFANGWHKQYRRGRSTYAFTLDNFAHIIYMWDNLVGMGSTYAHDGLMQEAEKMLPSKEGETADSVFRKYWINLKETIQQEYDERNKGADSMWPEPNDYLIYSAYNKCKSFNDAPDPVKHAFLYWLHKYCLEGSLDKLSEELASIPEFIKEIVDTKIMGNTEKN